jgi:tRNA-splicing ligase RtcB
MKHYITWGADHIEQGAKTQMDNAMSLPVSVAGALMPDAHQGYGLPIGGVLALDNAVCPFAVGVDIACRMKLSVWWDAPPINSSFQTYSHYCDMLEENTFFGVGVEHDGNNKHGVMHEPWYETSPVTRDNQEKARRQLGTSGSGNHFVEWGVLTIMPWSEEIAAERARRVDRGTRFNRIIDLEPGQYVALMSHSGSRGVGAAVCNHYTKIAKAQRPEYGDLAWLDLGTPAGDEYWAAMNLMGKYAAANHDVIHSRVGSHFGIEPISVENHHNFAWKETHGGREVIVHRKGATPAGKGVYGVIPGSMGTPAYVVRGKGNPDSLCSASHGAGRLMSRTQAKKTFDYKTEIEKLAARDITVLSAGVDEVCGVYKDIDQVMADQSDLVEIVARFDPKIVKMCGTKDRAED